MWTVVKVQDTEILRGVLDQWQAGIDAHQPERVAALFTEDAVFQGLHPYGVGRHVVSRVLRKPTARNDGHLSDTRNPPARGQMRCSAMWPPTSRIPIGRR